LWIAQVSRAVSTLYFKGDVFRRSACRPNFADQRQGNHARFVDGDIGLRAVGFLIDADRQPVAGSKQVGSAG
jgi:hypothetical protein